MGVLTVKTLSQDIWQNIDLKLRAAIDQLNSQDLGVRQNAAGALEIFAWQYFWKVDVIAQAGGITRLVALLSDVDPGVRQQVAGALEGLAGCSLKARGLIAEAGGIAPLVARLSDAETEVRKKSAKALGRLARSAENQGLIAREGGVVRLVTRLNDAESDVRKEAAEALEILAWSAENRGLIVREGGVALLVARLNDVEADVRESAVKVLAVFSRDADHQVLIVEAGGVSSLLALLGKREITIRRHAARLLRVLAKMSLGYERGIAADLQARAKKERDADVKRDLKAILSHWQKKTEFLSSNHDASIEDRVLLGPSMCAQISSSEHLDSCHLSQGTALLGMGAYTIESSEVRLGRRLGGGSFGDVYEAMYQFQKIAVKQYVGIPLRPDDRAKMVAEIALMASLKHKYLLAFLGVIELPSGAPSLVMEYGEKGSLYEYLGTHEDIPWSWRLRVADELARGLAYLHQKKFLHQNIKSLNVMLDDGLHAKWCDFGLPLLKQHATATQSHWGQMVGSARWMAPELFLDDPVVNQKSDIWSYGMVLFELATQAVPYQKLNERQVMFRLAQHEAEEVPEQCKQRVPKFAALMEVCWRRHEERPEASRVVEVLAEIREGYSEQVGVTPS